mgnify:CR=1 FL=1
MSSFNLLDTVRGRDRPRLRQKAGGYLLRLTRVLQTRRNRGRLRPRTANILPASRVRFFRGRAVRVPKYASRNDIHYKLQFFLRICLKATIFAAKMERHSLYIIAGPNGAGKTTASFSLLPDVFHCKHFVNADEIARGISPFAPEEVALQAGRIMLQRIDELLQQGVDFAIETTLATRSYTNLVKKAQAIGYKVFLVFFCLESVEQATMRVAQRVSEGGHDIPADTICRRFYSGLRNLFELYLPICNYVAIYNNAYTPAVLVAKKNGRLQIENLPMWNQIKNLI